MRPNGSTGYRGPPSETVAGNNKIVFVALGALFGLALFMFAMHIFCVKCILGRFEDTVTLGPEEDLEAMSPGTADMSEWRRRARRRRFFGERPRENHPSMSSHLGLDKAVVDILPTFVFNRESPPVRDVVECAVCLAEFADGDQGRLLPTCKHCFHTECIDMWFLSHSSCPLCRREVSVDFLEDFTLDNQLARSHSCPRFYDHILSSLSPWASFRDLRSFLEESGSGPSSETTTSISSPFSDITSQATTAEIMSRGTTATVAVTIHENDSMEVAPENSNVTGTEPDLESGASPKTESATVAAIEVTDEGRTSSESKPPDPGE